MNFYRAIIFTEPHAEMFAKGIDPLNIRAKYLPSIVNKNLLVVQNKKAYGIIKFTSIHQIHRKDLGKFGYFTKQEIKDWFPNKNSKLYLYEAQAIRIFKKPKCVNYPTGARILIKPENVTFC